MKKTKDNVVNKESSTNKNDKLNNKKNKQVTKDKKWSFSFLKKKNDSNKGKKKYKKKKKNTRYVNGRFSLDIWEILIIVVATALVSCVFTGLILNHQFRKNINYIDT